MIDCHCHYLDLATTEDFLDQLQGSQLSNGWCNSTESSQWTRLGEIADKYPLIRPFFGIHPWFINDTVSHDLEQLNSLLQDSRFSCGETGLDRLTSTDFSLQQEVFSRQLEIASSTDSFVAIHCVRAWSPLLEILVHFSGKIRFMIHSFQGSLEVMQQLTKQGAMISFSPRVIGHEKLQRVLRETPSANLMLETDYPYPASPGDNSPAGYLDTLSRLYTFAAGQRGVSLQELTTTIRKNGSICTG